MAADRAARRENTRLVPRWLAALTAVGSTAVLGIFVVAAPPADSVPAGASGADPGAQRIAPWHAGRARDRAPETLETGPRSATDWAAELLRERRRCERLRESLDGLSRTQRQIDAGSYPGRGEELLEARRADLEARIVSSELEQRAIEERILALGVEVEEALREAAEDD